VNTLAEAAPILIQLNVFNAPAIESPLQNVLALMVILIFPRILYAQYVQINVLLATYQLIIAFFVLAEESNQLVPPVNAMTATTKMILNNAAVNNIFFN